MSKYKLTQKTNADGTTQDIVLDASCVDGVVKSVNNQTPDANGNVNVSSGQATDVKINGTSITSNNVADIKTNGTYNATSNKIATMSDIPSLSGYYPKSGGALNSGAVITMTGSNPYVGLQETGGTQYYLQGYQGELGISVSGNWGTKRLSIDSNGKVFIPSKSIGDGTYTYTLPSKTGTVALTDDMPLKLTLVASVGSKTVLTTLIDTTVDNEYLIIPKNNGSSQASLGTYIYAGTSEAVYYRGCVPIIMTYISSTNVFYWPLCVPSSSGITAVSRNTDGASTKVNWCSIYKITRG